MIRSDNLKDGSRSKPAGRSTVKQSDSLKPRCRSRLIGLQCQARQGHDSFHYAGGPAEPVSWLTPRLVERISIRHHPPVKTKKRKVRRTR